jgi:hypothetical protein
LNGRSGRVIYIISDQSTVDISQKSGDREQKSETGCQKSEDRVQITDAGNQIAWIGHSRSSFDPPAQSIERCLTLCAMPFALCLFYP